MHECSDPLIILNYFYGIWWGNSIMSVVDDVKARLDIVDVVSGYVNLQKAGRNFKALCPFHHERTPSFVVFPDTQTWRCFGACGEGGDVFGFVMKAEGWDFSETLRELAKRAGVELEAYSPHQAEQKAESDRLVTLLDEAAHFFHDRLLRAPAAQAVRDYVDRRHLTLDTVERFVIGYAPDDWRQALEHLQLLGYSQDEIVDAGVAIRNEKGNVYDRFRHRLVIPIRDGRGRTVGFGARALNKDDNPKYLNSPQGPLFDKSALLFGLDMARRAIRETETAVVVEGYMDVMQAHQAGFDNVVAQMGTALTEAQLRQLDKYASRLVLALDPDAAGINATMRGLNVARQTLEDDQNRPTFDPRGMMRYTGMLDMDIRVVSLPEGKDPDDLIHEDRAAWEALIASAVPVADYVIQQGTAHLQGHGSYHERETVARTLLPILMATESDLQRNINIQALARRVRIDEQILIQWAQHRQSAQTRPSLSIRDQRRLAVRSTSPVSAVGPPGQSARREGFCLGLLLHQPGRLYAANRKLRELQGQDGTLAEVLGALAVEDFSRADYQVIFQAVERSLFENEGDLIEYLRDRLPGELVAVAWQLMRDVTDESIEHSLSKPLMTEYQSIRRDQARRNMVPELSTWLFIQEALTLRQSRLKRESGELQFVQEDAQTLDDRLMYEMAMRNNTRARQLITKALQQMKSFARET